MFLCDFQDCSNALKPEKIEQALDLLSLSHKHKIELIACQTEPVPCLKSEEETRYKWYHSSVELVMEKIFSMAVFWINDISQGRHAMFNKRLGDIKLLENKGNYNKLSNVINATIIN